MKYTPLSPKLPRGFTLMEMMLVLLIIVLILGAVAFNMQGITDSAALTTTKAKVNALESALTAYRLDNTVYPTQAQGLDALVSKPADAKRWHQYLKPEAIVDGWTHKMIYRNPGTHNPSGYDVYSAGPDGQDGTADDIGNW